MTRDEQRAAALDVIEGIRSIDGDDDQRRMCKMAAHGASRLAFRLSLITYEEWAAIDNGERVK